MPHRARKRFGQNFLHSESVIRRIVGSIAPARDDRIVEIGPGLGALTAPMLERVARLDVVELDRDLVAELPERLGNPDNLVIHQADALAFDFRALAGDDGHADGYNDGHNNDHDDGDDNRHDNRHDNRLRIIGNLPYNISTPLLFHLLDQSGAVVDMHFMLQKEVVERLAAVPGTKAWGRLGVMTQARAEVTMLFRVPPGAFTPAPKVESAVVRIVPRALSEKQRAMLPFLEKVVRAAFGQRRKTLKNTLKGVLNEQELGALNVDPGRRAETLSLEEFGHMAEWVSTRGDQS